MLSKCVEFVGHVGICLAFIKLFAPTGSEHRRSQYSCRGGGGGTRPTPPSHASVAYTFAKLSRAAGDL